MHSFSYFILYSFIFCATPTPSSRVLLSTIIYNLLHMLPFHSKLHDYATAEQTIIIEGPLLFDYEFMFHIFERSLAIVRVNSFYTVFTLLRMYHTVSMEKTKNDCTYVYWKFYKLKIFLYLTMC